MKKFVSIALIAASLAASARAFVLGADVGYLVDAKEEYVSGRLGHTLISGTSFAHNLEVEVGYTGQRESGLKGEFLPVTLNYRAASVAANKLGYHFGAGAGIARTKVSGWGRSDSGTSFAAQAFAGLNYQVSPAISLHAGAKYIWIEEVKLFGVTADVGDDVALSAGFSVKF